MKTPPVDSVQAPAVGQSSSTLPGNAASPRPHRKGMDPWSRLVAWLGLGCIGAANPAPGSKHCAPGCVRKPVDRKRRKRVAVAHRLRPRPPPTASAPGALARKSKQVLERVLFWVSP
jgi:hypothetical protein